MSQAPHIARGLRWGTPLGKAPPLEDSLWESLKDPVAGLSMAETAENLAVQYKLERSCVDEFAHRSQMLAKQAWDDGVFRDEVVPVAGERPERTGDAVRARRAHASGHDDGGARASSSRTSRPMALVTAGNASGIGDGAAALVVSSQEYAKRHGKKPLGRLVAWGVAGVDPKIMGIGPVPATKNALRAREDVARRHGAHRGERGVRAAGVRGRGARSSSRERSSTCTAARSRSATRWPHPAPGSRRTSCIHFVRRGSGSAWARACIGGGQGIAVIVEAFD